MTPYVLYHGFKDKLPWKKRRYHWALFELVNGFELIASIEMFFMSCVTDVFIYLNHGQGNAT